MIETATPSSAETIAALFDTLVDAVAKRVQAELADNITAQLEHAMDMWAMNSLVLEDKMSQAVQSFVDNELDIDDQVKQALDNLDLDDMVMTAVQELEFNVRVSR